MKKVLVVIAMAMFIGSSVFSLAQEPVKKTETTAPADSTKQEASIPTDTIPAATLTAEVV